MKYQSRLLYAPLPRSWWLWAAFTSVEGACGGTMPSPYFRWYFSSFRSSDWFYIFRTSVGFFHFPGSFFRNLNYGYSKSVAAYSGRRLLYFGYKFLYHNMVCILFWYLLTAYVWTPILGGFRSARLSILFSVIRIDPWERRRKRLLLIAILFLVAFAILLIQLFWVCEPNPAWKRLRNPQCPLSTQVPIFQLVSQ